MNVLILEALDQRWGDMSNIFLATSLLRDEETVGKQEDDKKTLKTSRKKNKINQENGECKQREEREKEKQEERKKKKQEDWEKKRKENKRLLENKVTKEPQWRKKKKKTGNKEISLTKENVIKYIFLPFALVALSEKTFPQDNGLMIVTYGLLLFYFLMKHLIEKVKKNEDIRERNVKILKYRNLFVPLSLLWFFYPQLGNAMDKRLGHFCYRLYKIVSDANRLLYGIHHLLCLICNEIFLHVIEGVFMVSVVYTLYLIIKSLLSILQKSIFSDFVLPGLKSFVIFWFLVYITPFSLYMCLYVSLFMGSVL